MTQPTPTPDGLLKRLDEASQTGLDLSPGDGLCADALAEIRRLQEIIATHDLCHNLHGKVDARAFADGCADEQRKLYGCAPDADELKRLRAEIQAHDDHYAHYPHNACGWNFSVAAAAAEGGVGR